MIITSIDKSNYEKFRTLIPEELALPLEAPGRFLLGAVAEEYEEGREEEILHTPAGVLAFEIDGGLDGEGEECILCRITWIYIFPDYRELGLGSGLMLELFRIVEDTEVMGLVCDLPFSSEYDGLMAWLHSFAFEFRLINDFVLRIQVGDLKAVALPPYRPNPLIHRLKQLSDRQFQECIQIIVESAVQSMDLVSMDRSYYEQDLSLALLDSHQRVSAFLLVRPDGDSHLTILYLMAGKQSDSRGMMSLIQAAIASALQKYGPDVGITVPCRREIGGRLIDKLFPDREPALVRRGILIGDEQEE